MESSAPVLLDSREQLNEVIKKYVEDAAKRRSELRDKIRESGKVELRRLPVRHATSFAAVDSGFPTYPTMMVGVSVATVTAVALLSSPRRSEWLIEERYLVEYGELDTDVVTAYARLMERELARRIISEESVPLYLDGELVITRCRSAEKLPPHWRAACTANDELMSAAMSAGVVIVGVVKRSKSRMLAAKLGVKNMCDRALASIVLDRGEAIVLPLEAKLTGYNIYVIYYAPLRGFKTAYRAEVLARSVEEALEAVGVAATEANPHTGLPWFLDAVDAKANVRNKQRAVYYNLLVILSRVPEHAVPANPQKKQA